jgi:hypothetical protein
MKYTYTIGEILLHQCVLKTLNDTPLTALSLVKKL